MKKGYLEAVHRRRTDSTLADTEVVHRRRTDSTLATHRQYIGDGQTIHRRRTDSTLADRKRRTMIYITPYIKKYIKWLINTNPTKKKNAGELGWSGRVSSSCPTSDAFRVTVATNLVISHGWEMARLWLWQCMLIWYFRGTRMEETVSRRPKKISSA